MREIKVPPSKKLPKGKGFTLKEVLEKEYPDIDFSIHYSLPGSETIILLRKKQRGKNLGVKVVLRDEILENLPPDLIRDIIEDAVRKLRDFLKEKEVNFDNPSSRSFL